MTTPMPLRAWYVPHLRVLILAVGAISSSVIGHSSRLGCGH